MKKFIVASIAAAAFCGAPALAADIPTKAPAYVGNGPVAAFDWSGFYFGAHVGRMWSDTKATYADVNPVASISGLSGQVFVSSFDKGIFGGQVGYQHQFDRLVIGVEGGGTTWTRNTKGTLELCPKTTIALFNCSANLNREILTAGARLGWSMGDWLPYLTGGYALAHFTGEVTNLSLAPVGRHIIRWSERTDGWYFGGGADLAIIHGFTLGVEYRHYDFGSRLAGALATIGGIPNSPLPNDNAKFKTSADTLTLRLNYKFSFVPR
jgi:outer membrane immunogenic protein